MPPVYITRQGAKLRIKNRRLRIEYQEEELQSIPLTHISQIVLFGNIGLTTPAIGALLAKNIEVIFLSQSGAYKGRLVGQVTPHVPLRRRQYHYLGDKTFTLALAQGFVTAKLKHQRVLLQRQDRNKANDLSAHIQRIRAAAAEVERKTALSSLRGVEGAAGAAYFSAYRQLFGPEWNFTKRARRPPPDPVNAMLSFGYTLLAGVVEGAVSAVGLDPYAGYYHQHVYNQPGLALDLMEEFRPVVDGLILRLIAGGQVTPADFEAAPEDQRRSRGVWLAGEGKKTFIQAFEARLDKEIYHPVENQSYPLRQCIQAQVWQVRRAVEKGTPEYISMGFR